MMVKTSEISIPLVLNNEEQQQRPFTATLTLSTLVAVLGSYAFGAAVISLLTVTHSFSHFFKHPSFIIHTLISFCRLDIHHLLNLQSCLTSISPWHRLITSFQIESKVETLAWFSWPDSNSLHSCMQFSIFGSILTIGAMIGAIVSGKVADYAGRRVVSFALSGWI